MGTLLVLFRFCICVVHASAFYRVENELAPRSPITMAPPKLDDRGISTICGFYYDTATPGSISTWVCDYGPCDINRYVTPNIAFCSNALLNPTKFYGYGGWPQGGCGTSEICCASGSPIVGTAIYDNGATYMYQCFTSSYTVSLYTQLQEDSVYLSPYTPPIDVAMSTSPTAAQVVTVTWIPSSTTSSLQSVASTASSTTASSGETTVPSSTNTNEIALAAGLGAGIPIIVLAASVSIVIFLRRRSKRARTHPDTQTVIEVDQTNLGGRLTR